MLIDEQADLAAPDAARLAERKRMQIQIRSLNEALLAHPSATAVLQALCDRRDGASPPIRARKLQVTENADESVSVRRELGASDDEPVCHRRVELMCGDRVLSRADNWYLPNRLSDEMNARLIGSETPFGVVVAALAFTRSTLSTEALYDPLASGWETRSEIETCPILSAPEDVLQHRAILRTPDGRGFSLLLETYTKQILTA
jgi:hypothetical protein